MRVTDRLGRLLFIVPYVLHRDGVPLRELAQVLRVSEQQIQADLDLLCMIGQPPLTPEHLVDIHVEDDIVYVELDQSLSRPLRLTHEEASALVLGAKLVGNLGGMGAELESVLARIIEHLNPVDRAAVQALSERVMVQGDGDAWAEQAALLRLAVSAHRVVRAPYYSVSSDRQKNYQLKPLALINHGGVDYLVALDAEAGDREKLFRLDRLGQVTVDEAQFTPPPAFDLEKFRKQQLYFGEGHLSAEVRFPPALAPQLRERFAATDLLRDDGEAVEVRVATSSHAWLSRWVLAFGEEAEVLRPEACRAYLHKLCVEAAEVYGTPFDFKPSTKPQATVGDRPSRAARSGRGQSN